MLHFSGESVNQVTSVTGIDIALSSGFQKTQFGLFSFSQAEEPERTRYFTSDAPRFHFRNSKRETPY